MCAPVVHRPLSIVRRRVSRVVLCLWSRPVTPHQVVTGPFDNLHELKACHERAVLRLVTAAESLGCHVLGFGIQPITPRGLHILTPRKRYEAMRKSLGEPWMWFTVTASDQVHVDIAEPELLRIINVRARRHPLVAALARH
jgi:gamma-glutamylcysteine synthetase